MPRIQLNLLLVTLRLFTLFRGILYIPKNSLSAVISNEGNILHRLKKISKAPPLSNQLLDKKIQDKLRLNFLNIELMTYQAINSNTWAP